MSVDFSKSTNLKPFTMGSVVIQEGSSSPKEMVLVLRGNIGVYKNYKLANETQLRVISQGSYHGEMSVFLNHEQNETLVALTDVVVMTIDRRNLKDFFVSQPDMAINIVEGICGKLNIAMDELYKLRPAELQAPSRRSALFPENHGSYSLPLQNKNLEYLYSTKVTCPLCDHSFDNLRVIQSKLRPEKTESDMRVRYKEFEPLYYDIVTCPNCFFSADVNSFSEISKRLANAVNQLVGPHKLEMYVLTGTERDTFTAFAGYYLAILCASAVFDDYQLITANLWLKLSWLYRDCNDDAMFIYASNKALEDYRYAYENLNISDSKIQPVCYMMGELYFRIGELDIARNFFFTVKTSSVGTAVLKRQADQRLDELRSLIK